MAGLSDPAAPAGQPPLVAVENLSVTFQYAGGLLTAVRDVSLAVASGETFGIVGESGSGKSTVLRAIAGLVRPAAGRIVIAGDEVWQRRSKAQRRALQFVFQDPYGSLHPRQTVDTVLREPLSIHGLPDADRRISAAMADVDLAPSFRFRYPHQLSGGQRQRVAVARALILDPKILLLDEPTSALDVSVQAEVLNLLARIRAAHGLTGILVSHDLAVVAHLCQRIAVMRRGAIVEVLSVETLRGGGAQDPYTRGLVAASRGYRRKGSDEAIAK